MLSGTRGAPGGGTSAGTPVRDCPVSRAARCGGSLLGSSSSSTTAVSRSGSPTATVALAASTASRGGRFAYHSSLPRPNPIPVFLMIVSSSISHSGWSQAVAVCSLPLWRTVHTSPSSNAVPMSAGACTENWKRCVRG